MNNKLLYWLSGFMPCRLINDGDRPYLERYYVGTLLGWRFYLHRFVGSDPAGTLHDHPWSKAYSLILSGWYWEETRSGTRRVRWFNSLTGDTFHRVVLPVLTPRWRRQAVGILARCRRSDTIRALPVHPRRLTKRLVEDCQAQGILTTITVAGCTFEGFGRH